MEVAMGMQLALPLEADSRNEASLRQAWVRSGLSLPFEVALRDRALAICLRNFAEAMCVARQKKTTRRRRG
jgi:hypothetical protein